MPRKEKKRRDKKREDKIPSTEQKFRLSEGVIDPIYKKFPRKLGKQDGYKKLKSVIKSPEDLEKFEAAVDRFCQIMAQENRAPDKIPYFSTFVNSQWQDYLSDRDWETDFSFL